MAPLRSVAVVTSHPDERLESSLGESSRRALAGLLWSDCRRNHERLVAISVHAHFTMAGATRKLRCVRALLARSARSDLEPTNVAPSTYSHARRCTFARPFPRLSKAPLALHAISCKARHPNRWAVSASVTTDHGLFNGVFGLQGIEGCRTAANDLLRWDSLGHRSSARLPLKPWLGRSDVNHAVCRTLLPRRSLGHDSAHTLPAHRAALWRGFIGTEPVFAGPGPGPSSEHCSLQYCPWS
jgi:hypothetical protein